MTEMRVQRALAQAGVASRRAAEALIRAGKVRVDGRVVSLGDKVDPDSQTIQVGRRTVHAVPRRWLAVHKPLGVVTTARDEDGRTTVFDLLDDSRGLAYVGRLDVMTTGLLLLTTDGEAIHRLTHPRYRIPRRYSVLVHGVAPQEVEALVRHPVVLDRRAVTPTGLTVRPGRQGRTQIELTLTEGRHHVVRRWCAELGLKVERLARLSYGPVRLGKLPVGGVRPLTPREIDALYHAVKLAPGGETGPR
jgi:pseudouridine synthase